MYLIYLLLVHNHKDAVFFSFLFFSHYFEFWLGSIYCMIARGDNEGDPHPHLQKRKEKRVKVEVEVQVESGNGNKNVIR